MWVGAATATAIINYLSKLTTGNSFWFLMIEHQDMKHQLDAYRKKEIEAERSEEENSGEQSKVI